MNLKESIAHIIEDTIHFRPFEIEENNPSDPLFTFIEFHLILERYGLILLF